MKLWLLTFILTISSYGLADDSPPPPVTESGQVESSSIEAVHAGGDDEDYDDYMDYEDFEKEREEHVYEREFTFVVQKGQIKTDFFLEMNADNVMDLTGQVMSVQEANGRPIPLTVTLKDDTGRVVVTKSNREGKSVDINHRVAKSGVYEVVFHVMDYYTDHKQLWVDLTVEGLPDPREYDKKFRIKKQKEYKDVHDGLIKSMKAMEKQHFSAIRHQMWRVHHTKRADIRVNALKGMIDKWSVIHIIMVIVVMCAQVFVLKGFFELPSSSSKI